MIYTFTIGRRPKAIKAENLEKAVSKIISRHLWSFTSREIHYISSNDPDVPKQEMTVEPTSFYGPTVMKPLSN